MQTSSFYLCYIFQKTKNRIKAAPPKEISIHMLFVLLFAVAKTRKTAEVSSDGHFTIGKENIFYAIIT